MTNGYLNYYVNNNSKKEILMSDKSCSKDLKCTFDFEVEHSETLSGQLSPVSPKGHAYSSFLPKLCYPSSDFDQILRRSRDSQLAYILHM